MFASLRAAVSASAVQRSVVSSVQQFSVRCFAAGKPKTHSGAKKRFKLTASGKVKYAQ